MGKTDDENKPDSVEQDLNLSRILAERGVTRRDFLRYCASVATMIYNELVANGRVNRFFPVVRSRTKK